MDSVLDALVWAFLFHYYRDKMNACIHCTPVRFSEITVRLCSALTTQWNPEEDWTTEMGEVFHSAMGE